MMYRYTIKQFIHFALYQVVFIYFKSARTKELFIISIIFKIIFNSCFKIWTICRGLVLFWPIAIIAFSRFLSKVRYKMSSQMLLQTTKSQSGFKNANILQFVLANVTPIGPPEKCKVAIHAIQTVFLDPINVGG